MARLPLPDADLRLRALADKDEIRDLLATYCRGIDRCDWSLAAGVYHADGIDDHGIFSGLGVDFVEFCKDFLPAFADVSQHVSLNCLIELDGDVAHAETYVVGWHRSRASADRLVADAPIASRLVDRCERRQGRWKLADRRLVFEWSRLDPATVIPLNPATPRGRRDPGDVSYANFKQARRSMFGSSPFKQVPAARPDEIIEQLIAKDEIRDVLMRAARALDRLDWELMRDCYHEDAVDHHGIFDGPRDAFIEFSKEFLPRWARLTMHTLGNCLIEVDGDHAAAETYIVGYHRGTDPASDALVDHTVAGRYVDQFERRGGWWRIAERTFVFEWSRSDPVRETADPPEGVALATRHRDDPSYASLQTRLRPAEAADPAG